jgi:hypothetical protein
MSRRTQWTILAGILLGAIAYFAFHLGFMRNPFDPLDAGTEPVSGQYVGQTRDAIERRFGAPSRVRAGHYYMKDPSAVTLLYERLSGTLYLSFQEVDGEWVCFSSDWVPKGRVPGAIPPG